jgi:hypothetical protein
VKVAVAVELEVIQVMVAMAGRLVQHHKTDLAVVPAVVADQTVAAEAAAVLVY